MKSMRFLSWISGGFDSRRGAIAKAVTLGVLSPTRSLYEYLASRARDRTLFAARWPVWFLSGELAVSLSLFAASTSGQWQLKSPLAIVLGFLAVSRINEIVYAYYTDAIDSLEGTKRNTALRAADRIKLAMKSYGSLLILWAILYFSLPTTWFEPAFCKFIDAVYFSGITIATVGYGDFRPVSPVTKMLCIAEVMSGMLVLVVALGSYLTGASHTRDSAED